MRNIISPAHGRMALRVSKDFTTRQYNGQVFSIAQEDAAYHPGYICGQKQMDEALTRFLESRGLKKKWTFNYGKNS